MHSIVQESIIPRLNNYDTYLICSDMPIVCELWVIIYQHNEKYYSLYSSYIEILNLIAEIQCSSGDYNLKRGSSTT